MMLLAFGFGSGLSPKAPGTAGSLLALLCMPILTYLPVWAYWCMLVLAFGAGVVICNYADRRLTGHDHPGIVWDEFVGLWLALASVPASWGWWLAGFLVFRCFDIFKPWPISVIDRKIAGGFGVMLDDLIAGCGAWLVTMTLVWLL
ncbi:MAG: phosphatidylglycerophosphatase A [Porticoccaceae bacterium]|nr:phosphatidylglycerophosphatase A [Porticoccaceae bacterium]